MSILYKIKNTYKKDEYQSLLLTKFQLKIKNNFQDNTIEIRLVKRELWK